MKYCIKCGAKLPNDARYCSECGTKVENEGTTTKNEREQQYEGTVYKCPNCGEVLDSLSARCPACGYEIRDRKSVSSVKELAHKLEKIENRTMPAYESNSMMKQVFGTDFRSKKKKEEERSFFEQQKEEDKANVIINFPIPNTKADIMEFMC